MSRIKTALMAGVAIAAFGFIAGNAQAETRVIHVKTLLAVPGEAPQDNMTIVVKDGVITEINEGWSDPAAYEDEEGVEMIHLADHFVMPGMIDSHTHATGEVFGGGRFEEVTLEPGMLTLRATQYLERIVDAGFTTIRNLGADPSRIYSLRWAAEQGLIESPRIVASGGVGITGGHGNARTYTIELDAMINDFPACSGPYECRDMTRNAIRMGADVIKIATTGGVLSDIATGTDQQMFDDEIQAIVDTAHSLGRKVAAHAHGTDGIMAALRAGVDSIEHGTYLDDEAIALMIEQGTYLVPTMLAGKTVVDMANEGKISSDAIREKALIVGNDMEENLGYAIRQGVKVAFGTDSGVSEHGINAEEFLLMRDAGGMSNEEMIISATISAADLLGISDTAGTIEVGKSADIIGVTGDPLVDIEELLDVDFVMARGHVTKQ